MKAVSFAMQVLIVIVVILIVALVVLSIFGGGMAGVGTAVSQLLGGTGQQTCAEAIPGASCHAGVTCPADTTFGLGGTCPSGQVCCVPV